MHMRRTILLAIAWILLGALGSERAQAQFFPGTEGYDPFNAYYGFYLPRQAAMAVQRSNGAAASVDALSAARQEAAYTDRLGLDDPISRYATPGQYDPANPFPDRSQGTRPGGLADRGRNSDGSGNPVYFNRTGRYFPGLKDGRGPNADHRTAQARRNFGRGMGGGMGMGGYR
jgi:hypothetical protein